jgi:hypothetical protein
MAITHRIHLLARITDATKSDSPLLGGGRIDNSMERAFTNGTGSGQANISATDTITVAAGATTQLDLSGGSLTQPDGSAATFAKVKAIMVTKVAGDGEFKLQQPAANGVVIFANPGDGTKEFTTTGGGCMLYWPEGVTVTAGTGDLIDIVETGSSDTVDVTYTIIGTSA